MSNPFSPPYADAVVDLRGELRVVGDQGRRGTCIAFAVTAVHEHQRGKGDGADPEDLSEETLYWGCKQFDGMSGSGTRASAADLALQRWGQPAEVFWSYDETRDDQTNNYQPPGEAIKFENCHRTSLRTVTPDLTSIRTELDSGIPVIAGMRVWQHFRRPTVEPLPAPTPGELFPTGHAVVIVGYDQQRAALLIRNSWGPRWGNNGHLWVADAIVPLLIGAWAIAGTATSTPLIETGDVVFSEESLQS